MQHLIHVVIADTSSSMLWIHDTCLSFKLSNPLKSGLIVNFNSLSPLGLETLSMNITCATSVIITYTKIMQKYKNESEFTIFAFLWNILSGFHKPTFGQSYRFSMCTQKRDAGKWPQCLCILGGKMRFNSLLMEAYFFIATAIWLIHIQFLHEIIHWQCLCLQKLDMD